MGHLLGLAAAAILVVTPWTLYPYVDGQRLWFRVFVALAVLVSASTRLRLDAPPLRLRLLDWLVLGWFVALAVSSALAVSPVVAVFGSFERGEGLFQAGFYVAWFLLLRRLDEWGWRVVVRWIVWTATIAVLVPHFVNGRQAGTFGNATLLGAYAVFALFMATWVGWGFHLVALLAGLLAAQAKAAALGLAAGCLAHARLRYGVSWAVLAWFAAAAAGGAGLAYRASPVRPYLTRIGIEGVSERPLFGHGPGGYADVFHRHFPVELLEVAPGELWHDRAHCLPVDVAVEGGLVGLGFLLAAVVVAGMGLCREPLWFGALVAILTLGLATLPSFPVWLAFWTVMGRSR